MDDPSVCGYPEQMQTRALRRLCPGLLPFVVLLDVLLYGQPAVSNRFEEEIRKFEEQDRAAFPKPGQILFLGSSSIRLWDLPRYFPGLDVINRGFGGSEIADSVYFMDRIVVPYRPRTIVFYAGDNDIASGKTAEQVARDFQAFSDAVHQRLPSTRIIYISIKPSPSRWALVETMREANRLIEAQARQTDFIRYLDIDSPMIGEDGRPKANLFVEDKLHLNDAGYTLWTSRLRPLL